MSILSLTFHATPNIIESWDEYMENELSVMVENLKNVENYILSEVQTEMITDGKNTNLFLVFENDEFRNQFMDFELLSLEETILNQFGQEVMIFPTFLNPIKKK